MTALELTRKFPKRYEIKAESTDGMDLDFWLYELLPNGGKARVIGSSDNYFSGVEFLPNEKGELGTIFM